jgi:hypothetical protein
LEPEFGYIKDGHRRLVQLWNSKGANLTRIAAGVGIYLLRTHLACGEFADCDAGVLDLRRRDLFVYDALPLNVQAMVASELAWAASFFKLQKKAA